MQHVSLEIAAVLIGNGNVTDVAQTEQQTEHSHNRSTLLLAMS